jgi:methyl-accepting chemotaxis protein
MKFSSIKVKLIVLISGIGIVLSLILAFVAPNQAKNLGHDVMKKDIKFTAKLLADNLSIGMQTIILDDGAAIDQTLALLKSKENSKQETEAISDVQVFDNTGSFVAALNSQESAIKVKNVTDLDIEETGSHFLVWSPLKDSDQSVLGHVYVQYSKQNLNQQVASNQLTSVLIALIILLGTLAIAVFFSRSVTGSILKVTAGMQDIAEGDADLTKHLEIRSNDEVSELADWFNTFLDRLDGIISQVKDNTFEVSSATTEINNTAVQMADGAEKQASQASEVASAIQQMTASILENSANATHTAEIVNRAAEITTTSYDSMKDNRKSMDEIVASTEKTGVVISSLSTRAAQIDEIIQVIEDIADQTNLLALNAAIEAARAGEQGRGFAVVADEVRKLAERTTKATGEIAKTIKAIQDDTQEADNSMNEAKEVVKTGKEATIRTEEMLNEIKSSVVQAMDMINQIAAATEEMSAGAEEISKNMESISSVTKESAVGSEKMAVTAEQLNKRSEALEILVNQFKLQKGSDKVQPKNHFEHMSVVQQSKLAKSA